MSILLCQLSPYLKCSPTTSVNLLRIEEEFYIGCLAPPLKGPDSYRHSRPKKNLFRQPKEIYWNSVFQESVFGLSTPVFQRDRNWHLFSSTKAD